MISWMFENSNVVKTNTGFSLVAMMPPQKLKNKLKLPVKKKDKRKSKKEKATG